MAFQNRRVEFRRLKPSDIEAVTAFAVQGMRPDLYPGHLDMNKVRTTVRHFCHSASDWHLAAFDGDQVVGICAVQVSEQPWFERHQATVVALYAVVPGVGRRLVRDLMAWYGEQPMLRRLHWPQERGASRATCRFGRMAGFDKQVAVLMHEKG